MRLTTISSVIGMCFCLIAAPARAAIPGDLGTAEPRCQVELGIKSPRLVQRLTLPYVDQNRQLVALTSVIPDFDHERDVVVGIRPGRHTYLINALIGRYDPGIFGARGRFHLNEKIGRLTVSPGLVMRLRLSATMVARMAVEMGRKRNKRSLTCTNTAARLLAHAGVPGMHPFIFTPRQLIGGFGRFEEVDARMYLVNADAESLEDFEDEVKVIGAKKKPAPSPEANQARRTNAGRCDDEDSCDCGMLACMDLDWCTGSSESGECSCGESNSCEGGCDSGGSDCGDSDCCH